jgi:hypothetical protein
MKRIILTSIAFLALQIKVVSAQDLISGGSNSWIFHTPDDGRTKLYIAPLVNGSWNWGAQTIFSNNGDLQFSGKGVYGNNVKIFGTDEAWAEGLAIIRPSGWSGIRLCRNDPAGANYNGNWALGFNGFNGNDFSISTNYNGTQYDGLFHISNSTRNVGIGTTTPGSYKLAVAGKIAATGEVKVFVDGTTTFPDYVFDPSYKLPTLEETEKYVKENHHLPEVPTAADIAKDGMSLNEMNIILLKKVEELTLYMIEMKKENDARKAENDQMKQEIKELKENQKK